MGTNMLRHMVSRRRIRYKNSDYDLDLTYITDRVIAMGFPAESIITTIFRNPIDDVARFLEHTHCGHYRVYNLCEGTYDCAKFNNQVANYPFPDHHPPPLKLINKFMEDLTAWLDSHPSNVAAIHCVGGKGRTGTMICCWLLRSKICNTASEAVQLFAEKRTKDGKGVIQPSQLRYITIYEECLNNRSLQRCAALTLVSISTTSVPNFKLTGGCDPWFSIVQQGRRIFFSEPAKIIKGKDVIDFSDLNIPISGDITIEFFHKDFKKKMFSFSFHTNYVKKDLLTMHKRELDGAFKDKNNKHFHSNFKVDVTFYAFSLLKTTRSMILQTSADKTAPVSTLRSRSLTDPPLSPRDSLRDSPHVPHIVHPTHHEMHTNRGVDTNRVMDADLSVENRVAKCMGCGLAIITGSFSLGLSGKAYHWECVSCDHCGKKFSSAIKQCLIKKERVCCENCGELRAFFPDCVGCKKKVSEEPCVKHKSMRWHIPCFVCVSCDKNLAFQSAYGIADGAAYCEDHLPQTGYRAENHIEDYDAGSVPYTSKDLPPWKQKSEKVRRSTHSEHPTPVESNRRLGHSSYNGNSTGEHLHAPRASEHVKASHDGEHFQASHAGDHSQAPHASGHSQAPHASERSQAPHASEHLHALHADPGEVQAVEHVHKSNSQQVEEYGGAAERGPYGKTRAGTVVKKQPSQEFSLCARCVKPLVGEFLNADGKLYHPLCMTCDVCGVSLEDNTRICQVGDKWYCRKDYTSIFGTSCGQCAQTIEPGAPYFSSCGKFYHVTCFVCTDCGVELVDGVHFVRNNLPVCEAHKEVAIKDPEILLYESITVLIRSAKNIFELNPEADRGRLVLLAKQLARSGKRFVADEARNNRVLYEQELNAAHSNFVDFCLEMLVDNDARAYLMSRKKFVSSPDSFVYSAKLLEKVIKFCAQQM